MFDQAAAGGTVIVLEVSRLARSTQQLCEIIERVREKRLRLVIVGSITLDCRSGQADPMSEAFLQMAGVFSQLELAMIRSRVRSGMENARAKGRQIGRPQVSKEDIPAAFLRHYPAHKSGQLNISELARVCDISRTTAYKYIGLFFYEIKPKRDNICHKFTLPPKKKAEPIKSSAVRVCNLYPAPDKRKV